jgi:hypothetical protein
MSGSAPTRIDRPAIPAEYGTAKATDFVAWEHVEDRLTNDRVCWVATVGSGGRPSIRPIDGLYLDGTVYIGGSPETRWVRDLADNPNVAIHLDGLDHVIVLEGSAEVMSGLPSDLAKRLAAASNAKFPEYRMTARFYQTHGAIAVRPRSVVSWTDITRNPTRFRFG